MDLQSFTLIQLRKQHPNAGGRLRRLWPCFLLLLMSVSLEAHPPHLALNPARPESAMQIKRLEQRLQRNPEDALTATRLVHHYLHRHRVDSSNLWIQKSEAAVSTWTQRKDTPPLLLAEMADLNQRVHRFRPALNYLEQLLAQNPKDAQAVLSQSTILTVLGRYVEAAAANEKLKPLTSEAVVRTNCYAIDSLRGKAAECLAALEADLGSPPSPTCSSRRVVLRKP